MLTNFDLKTEKCWPEQPTTNNQNLDFKNQNVNQFWPINWKCLTWTTNNQNLDFKKQNFNKFRPFNSNVDLKAEKCWPEQAKIEILTLKNPKISTNVDKKIAL